MNNPRFEAIVAGKGKITKGEGCSFKEVEARILCADGVSLSVQASRTHYCVPRDDHGHIASSTRKRLTERYTRTSPESLQMQVTVEDSLFLSEPYTWVRELRPSGPPGVWGECDPEQSRRQLDGLPSKYDE